MPTRSTKTRAVAIFAVLALPLGLAACGDDDDDATDDPSGSDAAASGGDSSEDFCAASLAIEVAPEPDIDFESATEEETAAAVATYGAETMRPLADDIVASAPDEIADDLAILSAAVDELAGGNPEAFEQPDVAAASDRFDAFVDDECGWASHAVTLRDYRFEGLPSDLDAGPNRFRVANEGTELHELLLLRRNPGTDMSVEELFELSQEEAFELVTPAGPPAFAVPGDSESVVYDLEPGRYIALCMIPTGLTGFDVEPAPDAPPHAAQGMVREITVS